ncbi:hypothetical protein D3C81_300690 [compost metagenome]
MFITHRFAEIKHPVSIVERDYRAWHFVEKLNMEPWFHVAVTRPQQGDTATEIVLIENTATLKIFIESFSETYKLKSIKVVTPGTVNGTGDWLMEPVFEVRESMDGAAIRYTLEDQKQYYFPSISAAPADAYNRKIYG